MWYHLLVSLEISAVSTGIASADLSISRVALFVHHCCIKLVSQLQLGI